MCSMTNVSSHIIRRLGGIRPAEVALVVMVPTEQGIQDERGGHPCDE